MAQLSINTTLAQAAQPTSKHFAQERQAVAQAIWTLRKDNLPDTPPPEEFHIAPSGDEQAALPVSSTESPVVAVIGVGYVGFHLVENFAAHYDVIAFDVSKNRLATVSEQLAHHESITFTTDARQLASATHFLVSVPTLLLPGKQIDTSYLRSAIGTIALHGRPGATVVIESSVAVGMTRELLSPLMQTRGIKAGMSPERVDPGRVEPPTVAIPKIISGLDDITPGSLESIQKLYSKVFYNVVTVSRPEVAEMMKLYENCQRMMCIAFANEMADACLPHGIDPYEVSKVAATKPFGYMPFSPSLGVGGHCIPVNPYYLLSNSEFPLLQAATEKMWRRPSEIARRSVTALNTNKSELEQRSPRVLVVGAGFKPGQSVLSHSPGIDLMKSLIDEHDAEVAFADPLVDQSAISYVRKLDEKTEWNKESLEWFDLIVVGVKQHGLDFTVLDNLDQTVTTVEYYTQ